MDDAIEANRLIFPGLAALYQRFSPLSYPLMRFIAGAILIPHGYVKLFGGVAPIVANNILAKLDFPFPLAWAYWLGILELLGGAMLAIGLLTRPIALLLVIEFIVITFFWNFRFGFSFTAQGGGFEYPLVLLILYVAIFFQGGGRYSLDRLVGREI
ncbi:MAG TPA: DoxX family protein [Stellaceae bacterium]|nr:DoxX family protein [Stellaceae bacterium]